MDPHRHIDVFNAAVASGEWAEFVELFADDGRVEFVGPPVGPFVGTAAIAEAYAASPPDDTIAMAGHPQREGDELVVPYRWETTGATGTMRFTEAAGRIARLVVTFD